MVELCNSRLICDNWYALLLLLTVQSGELIHLCVVLYYAAFAPMNYGGGSFVRDDTPSRNQPLDAQRYFSEPDSSD